MHRPIFHTIWMQGDRPAHFPESPELDRLVDSGFDPAVGYIKQRMKRRNARALRKGILGPKGVRQVPDRSGGIMELPLPKGWTLRLTYYAAGAYDFKHHRAKAGDVDAEFIPPRPPQRLSTGPDRLSLAV